MNLAVKKGKPGQSLILGVFAGGLASLAIAYGLGWTSPVIRSDGLGHYLYLPAAFIDRDLSLQTTVDRSFHGRPPDWAGVNRVPGSDRLLLKFPIGEAVMLAPFFLAADLLTLATRWAPPTDFAAPYQTAVAVGGVTYLALGLWWLGRLLSDQFPAPVVRWTLLVLLFGTNLFHYGTYDNVFSHVYSFAAVAGCLLAVVRWYAAPGWKTTVCLGGLGGLVTIIRPTNTVLLLCAVLYGIWDTAGLRDRWRFWLTHWRFVALGALVYAGVVSVQLAYWKFVTGHWVVYAYEAQEVFHFDNPQLLNVLFSVRKGLFFWAPVLLLAAGGFFTIARSAPAWRLPAAVVLPANLYIIASWHDWAYGGSFGHRAFVESLPLFAIGYAGLLQKARESGRHRPLVVCSVVLASVTTLLMIKYWIHVLPYDRTTWPQLWTALTRWRI